MDIGANTTHFLDALRAMVQLLWLTIYLNSVDLLAFRRMPSWQQTVEFMFALNPPHPG